jgi:hypothetical protein
MNKKFIALQILRVSLGSSSLFCTDEASLQTTKAIHHARVPQVDCQKLIIRVSLDSFSLFCADQVARLQNTKSIHHANSLFCANQVSLQTTKATRHAKVLHATRQKLINRLSERMNESCKSEVIEVVTKVPAECLNTFEAVVNRISEYMSVDDKFHVIKATAVVPTTSLLLEFAEVFNRLTHRLSDRNRSYVIKTMAKIPAKYLTVFEAVVNRLCHDKTDIRNALRAIGSVPDTLDLFLKIHDVEQRLSYNISGNDIINLIDAMTYVPLASLTLEFAEVVNHLSCDVDIDAKMDVISAIKNVPLTALTLEFVQSVNHFCFRMKKKDKMDFIRTIGEVPAERLTFEFVQAVHRLSQGMSENDKINFIDTLEYMPANHIAALDRLSLDMSENDKINFIDTLKYMPADDVAALEAIVNDLYGYDKLRAITTLAEVSAESLTENILQQFSQYVPYFERNYLITRLVAMEPEHRQAEITRVINEYRHDADARAGQSSVAFEVHNYANTLVSTSSGSSSISSSISAFPMRLNDAVIEKMNQRLQMNQVDLIPHADARAFLEDRIEQKYSSSSACSSSNPAELERAKHAAFSKSASDVEYQQVISTTVSFLQKFHPESIDLWLDGFLTESMNAYRNGGESCSKGIKERVASGMRTIDPELNMLFSQAEGPVLAKAFMAGLKLNDSERCKVITKELIERGLTISSNAAEAAEVFVQYMSESLASYGVSVADYTSQLQTMKNLVGEQGGFETYIQPILTEGITVTASK